MENVSPIITAKNLNLWYGDFKALKDISLDMGEREITALIGPSGCGKSTFLKTLNRMNDLVPGIRIEGDVRLKGQDIFAREMQPTELRRRVGMVFQKANPFPMSIYDNIRLKRIVSGTNTQDCPVTIAYKKSVHPIPVPNAPKAPYVHVWESAPMINSPGHT